MKGNINFSSQDQTENISKKNKLKDIMEKGISDGEKKTGKEKIENAVRMRSLQIEQSRVI